ncbi:MAG: hypothetical protein KDC27_18785 [Acidobacteria bacterium]|nr:hypothetical protein [Acidobacteriota bacterium]
MRNGEKLYSEAGRYMLPRDLTPYPQRGPIDNWLLEDEAARLIDMGLLMKDRFGFLRAGPNLI